MPAIVPRPPPHPPDSKNNNGTASTSATMKPAATLPNVLRPSDAELRASVASVDIGRVEPSPVAPGAARGIRRLVALGGTPRLSPSFVPTKAHTPKPV